ncbi:uncharacterized protein LOC107035498 [Diachasma alloeum]|uniref:uncharacterized protein LOC107035498 n=1 Tax=Diachasma alloeum TaxID=454923 RepID=UPI00073850F4|nr:uncharacterized protein LOC107035498 [Diachasma alloeum]
MGDEEDKSPCNHLSAKELMLTRGIRAQAYDEYARSSLVLPKCGEKLFEPNGSWLQEKQISTNLENMRDLLKIERVNRLSQLAVAEWLPNEKRALVTKRSGVEWTNYGIELNRNLYLIPEEALLLLELNCLELMFNGLSLSIHQAYELLLDSPHSSVTLPEYRVFSHLSRLGYRLQRFHYDKPERSEDVSHPKKKVIVVPENGEWMTDQKPLKESPEAPKDASKIEIEVKETLKTMINTIETDESPEPNGNSQDPEDPKKPKSTRLEIVSEETMVNPIKIVRPSDPSNQTPKWTASRIQRNVKQLPRRNDNKRKLQISSDKRPDSDSPQSKKPKHEVIELSDDDVQEIPIIPSRMDLLNQFPNTANNNRIRITSEWIPPNVSPQRTIYQCDRGHLERVNETDKALRSSGKSVRCLTPYDNRFSGNRYPGPSWRQNWPPNYQNGGYGFSQGYRGQYYPGNWVQQRIQENLIVNQMNTGGFSSRWSSFQQVNIFRNSLMLGYNMAAATIQNSLNLCNSVMWQTQNFFRGRGHDPRGQRGFRGAGGPRMGPPRQENEAGMYQASFVRVPASSWSELKQKWREDKTITIDDEEDKVDCSEVELVEENIQPLVGARHAGNVGEVFERLRIIKAAGERTVRKKRGEHRISYKVFANNMAHFRKANPGTPMFHVVVTSYRKQFPQPVELNRLQQDCNSTSVVFAVVSDSSTVYLQTGVISLPNLANEY